MSIAGLGNAAAPQPGATRVLALHQAEIGYQLARIAKPRKIANLGDDRHGIDQSDAAAADFTIRGADAALDSKPGGPDAVARLLAGWREYVRA
jgi:hypothetical protein